jgi:hypothetical protein
MPMPYGMLSAPRISPSSYKLTIELVPERQWGSNLRALTSATQWDKVGAEVFAAAGGRCEICEGIGRMHPLECHEVWRYDEDPAMERGQRTQILLGLQALCPACHRVKHLGFADKHGWLDSSIEHMAAVNTISKSEARAYVDWAYGRQKRRSTMRWEQDISWFKERFPGRLRSERAQAKLTKEISAIDDSSDPARRAPSSVGPAHFDG